MSSCQISTAQQEMQRGLTFRFDTKELDVERIAVYPYPDLKKLWVRVQLSAFATPVVVQMFCRDAQNNVVSEMLLVDWRDTYISLTMHLKKPPVPDATYALNVRVMRDETVLDDQQIDFLLTFVDPGNEH